jgi:hypothetical protein
MKPTAFDIMHAIEMVHSRDWIDPVDYPDDCWVSPRFRAVLLKGQLTFARNIRRRK